MKYNVKYEVKDVTRIINNGLASFNSETELDCVNLKLKLKEWFTLPSGTTTTSEVLELNGKPLNDSDIVPFINPSLKYKLEVKTPSSVKLEERQQLVKNN